MVWNYGFMFMKNNQAAIRAYKKSNFTFSKYRIMIQK
jgi:hypothetical protein